MRGSPAVTVVPPRRVIWNALSRAPVEPAISKAYSTPPPVAALTSATTSGSRALKVSVAPSSRANASLCSDESMATICRAPAATAPRREARPTPPRPMTATEEPAGHLGGVEHRTDTGQHGAAEQGGLVQRQVLVDLDQRVPRHGGVVGERGDAEVMVDRGAVGRGAAAEPPTTRSRPRSPPRPAHTARAAHRARLAMPAGGHEHEHHMITGREVRPGPLDRPDLLDDAGRLMPQRHRHRPRPVAR